MGTTDFSVRCRRANWAAAEGRVDTFTSLSLGSSKKSMGRPFCSKNLRRPEQP